MNGDAAAWRSKTPHGWVVSKNQHSPLDEPLYPESVIVALREENQRLRESLASSREVNWGLVRQRCQMDDEIEALNIRLVNAAAANGLQGEAGNVNARTTSDEQATPLSESDDMRWVLKILPVDLITQLESQHLFELGNPVFAWDMILETFIDHHLQAFISEQPESPDPADWQLVPTKLPYSLLGQIAIDGLFQGQSDPQEEWSKILQLVSTADQAQ